MHRHAGIAVEVTIAVLGMGLITLIAAGIGHDRQQIRRTERIAADLDLAQNLLDAWRSGGTPALPAGWTIQIRTPSPGIEAATIGNSSCQLTTLRRVNP